MSEFDDHEKRAALIVLAIANATLNAWTPHLATASLVDSALGREPVVAAILQGTVGPADDGTDVKIAFFTDNVMALATFRGTADANMFGPNSEGPITFKVIARSRLVSLNIQIEKVAHETSRSSVTLGELPRTAEVVARFDGLDDAVNLDSKRASAETTTALYRSLLPDLIA